MRLGKDDKGAGMMIRYIMMTLMKGLGPVGQNRLLNACSGDIEKLFSLSEDELSGLMRKRAGADSVRLFDSQRYSDTLLREAQAIEVLAEKSGVKLVTREMEEYPDCFRGIRDMPVLLYVKGELKINDYPATIGVVGARRCSREGRDTVISLIRDAVMEQSAVISGMAKGIDSYAHTAAIKEGGYTIAVLGNGVDICYPKEHQALYEAIISSGCILSEYSPGTEPRRYMFPRRNRLIGALSDELYVIEAGRHSGTQSTVEACMRYGHEVNRIDWTGGRSPCPI